VPKKIPQLAFTFWAIQIEFFPCRYPVTSASEYFGGIDISMRTWSGISCPSSIWHSLRRASSWNTVAPEPPDLPKQILVAVLRRERDMVLALSCRMVQVIMIL
jgi:hypothetical protein